MATNILRDAKDKADLLIHVVDATNLYKTIGYAIEVQGLGVPVVVALNMMDEARARGLELDIKKMSEIIGSPVVELVAAKNEGVEELKQTIKTEIKNKDSLLKFLM